MKSFVNIYNTYVDVVKDMEHTSIVFLVVVAIVFLVLNMTAHQMCVAM